jgi:sulfite reductase alpha subunit-like flavoprotein
MKKFLLFFTLTLMSLVTVNAQGWKGLINKITKDTSSKSSINKVITAASSYKKDTLSNNTIVSGLKEALQVGTERGTAKLSAVDGFFKDAAIKILMPTEAQNVEQKLRSIGFGKQVDNAILTMNRAAEDASKKATPIFINAIKQMSIQDAVGILKGGDFAATEYLKGKTTLNLTEAFKPVIEQSLAKVNATKYWNTVFTTYNAFSSQKVNTDLTAYVTEKALSGIFHQVALEEQKIRKDPVAQTTDILKKVFGK